MAQEDLFLCWLYWLLATRGFRKQMPWLLVSQKHRMVGVGRDLCGSSGPTPLPKQHHLEQAAQGCIQTEFEYLQEMRLHNPSGQPLPLLHHPQSEEVLTHVQTELPLLQSVPIAPCPVAGHHCKESGPILLTPTLQIFISIYKVPSPLPSFIFYESLDNGKLMLHLNPACSLLK